MGGDGGGKRIESGQFFLGKKNGGVYSFFLGGATSKVIETKTRRKQKSHKT